METLTVVWAANTYWDSPFQVGANNIAREFVARGMRVAFVSDPISPWHLLAAGARDTFRGRWATWRAGGREDLDGRVYFYSPFALLVPANRPILRTRFVQRHWHQFTLPPVVQHLRAHGFGDVDLLIIDTATQHFWLDALRYRRSVARVTDLFAGFQKATPSALCQEAELIRRADAVAYTARNLEPLVRATGARRAAYTPNGVDASHLVSSDRAEPRDLASIPRPRAIYVGALDEWFDAELVARCAGAYPAVSFIIIGPVRTDLSCLHGLPNVHVLGARPHPEIGRYLWNVDVGLIPFRADHPVIRSVHPIKLYEYIACELPVVSTRWEELDTIDLDFCRANDRGQFVAAIGDALAAGPRPQSLDAYAWRRTADRILELAFE